MSRNTLLTLIGAAMLYAAGVLTGVTVAEDLGYIRIEIGQPGPTTVNNLVIENTLAANASEFGVASVNVNVPDRFTVEPAIDPMDEFLNTPFPNDAFVPEPTPTQTTSDWDRELADLLDEIWSRPQVYPNQITSVDQLYDGMKVYICNGAMQVDPMTVVSVYQMLTFEDVPQSHMMVLLLDDEGNKHEYRLADLGVVPYDNGIWNQDVRLFRISTPPPPTLMPLGKHIAN